MIDVVALGELLIDFAAKSTDAAGYPTMAANPGGAPGNFLAALNAYGRKTAFLGKVGNDAFGHLLLGTLNGADALESPAGGCGENQRQRGGVPVELHPGGGGGFEGYVRKKGLSH